MDFVVILKLILSVADRLASYLHDKQLMDAGAAKAALAGIRQASTEVQRAQQIRRDVRDNLDKLPDGLPRDDPNRRD